MFKDLILRIRAFLHFNLNIGNRPKVSYWLKQHIDNADLVSTYGQFKDVIDNIVYIGGPEHIVRFYIRRIESVFGEPNITKKFYDDVSLTNIDHYSICVLFKYAYDNRALVESNDGFDTNMTLVGEPLNSPSADMYPHPYLIKVKHPSGSCFVKPVKYKLFQIDII
jgi:hypothetical protein